MVLMEENTYLTKHIDDNMEHLMQFAEVQIENNKLKDTVAELDDDLDNAIEDVAVVHDHFRNHYQILRNFMIQAARASKWEIGEESEEWKAAYESLSKVYDRIDRIPPTEYGTEGSGSESEQR